METYVIERNQNGFWIPVLSVAFPPHYFRGFLRWMKRECEGGMLRGSFDDVRVKRAAVNVKAEYNFDGKILREI